MRKKLQTCSTKFWKIMRLCHRDDVGSEILRLSIVLEANTVDLLEKVHVVSDSSEVCPPIVECES